MEQLSEKYPKRLRDAQRVVSRLLIALDLWEHYLALSEEAISALRKKALFLKSSREHLNVFEEYRKNLKDKVLDVQALKEQLETFMKPHKDTPNNRSELRNLKDGDRASIDQSARESSPKVRAELRSPELPDGGMFVPEGFETDKTHLPL